MYVCAIAVGGACYATGGIVLRKQTKLKYRFALALEAGVIAGLLTNRALGATRFSAWMSLIVGAMVSIVIALGVSV